MTNREKFNQLMSNRIAELEKLTNDQLVEEVYHWDSWFSKLFFEYVSVVKGKANSKIALVEWLREDYVYD